MQSEIERILADIEAKRAAMPPDERAALEAAERIAQRESWIRAMAPCEHGDADWETCPECRAHLEQHHADAPQPQEGSHNDR